ncbi:hypothetical protein WJ47_20145 [Burkholderia ubonensis]|uniref:Uncharacterized protein n=2 Tax=Burkholderia ubonensis TaxID=101571 RepID=A0AB73G1J6_9BURK|nr:hypothetical protein WJ47_20145 [Burkholderia ubonensis]KVM30341.1 hypothetical protein WJ53_06685 [Burkholderia ubonensis]KVR16031.1 hypothetical protein WK13_09910 [Burkholderia ubonensis]KWC28319.1 hypothetical protein WL48_26115 [Burkholderia ubonensis]KWC32865.1 hypothetical protein WL49_24470 [Burkholderia ubonensis]
MDRRNPRRVVPQGTSMLIGYGNACVADRSRRDDVLMRVTVPCLSAGVRLNDMRLAARIRLADLAAVIRRGRAARRESGLPGIACRVLPARELEDGEGVVRRVLLAARTKQSGRRGA